MVRRIAACDALANRTGMDNLFLVIVGGPHHHPLRHIPGIGRKDQSDCGAKHSPFWFDNALAIGDRGGEDHGRRGGNSKLHGIAIGTPVALYYLRVPVRLHNKHRRCLRQNTAPLTNRCFFPQNNSAKQEKNTGNHAYTRYLHSWFSVSMMILWTQTGPPATVPPRRATAR